MKKLISFFLSFAVLVCLGVPAFAADSASGAASGKDVILEEYPFQIPILYLQWICLSKRIHARMWRI